MATDKSTQKDTPKGADKDPEKGAAEGNDRVQEATDQELDQGFRGTEIDQTPNENYTVKGVTSGAPVPEAAENPVAARREASAS